jgi:hypothetical protein
MQDLPQRSTEKDARDRLAPYLKRGFRCCIIFQGGSTLYLEPDGKEAIGQPPSGGFGMKQENDSEQE